MRFRAKYLRHINSYQAVNQRYQFIRDLYTDVTDPQDIEWFSNNTRFMAEGKKEIIPAISKPEKTWTFEDLKPLRKHEQQNIIKELQQKLGKEIHFPALEDDRIRLIIELQNEIETR